MPNDGHTTVRVPTDAADELDDACQDLNRVSALLPPDLQKMARRPHAFTKGESFRVAVRLLREYAARLGSKLAGDESRPTKKAP